MRIIQICLYVVLMMQCVYDIFAIKNDKSAKHVNNGKNNKHAADADGNNVAGFGSRNRMLRAKRKNDLDAYNWFKKAWCSYTKPLGYA